MSGPLNVARIVSHATAIEGWTDANHSRVAEYVNELLAVVHRHTDAGAKSGDHLAAIAALLASTVGALPESHETQGEILNALSMVAHRLLCRRAHAEERVHVAARAAAGKAGPS